MPYESVLSTHGDPGDTYSVTGTDAAQSLADYGIPITRGDGAPAIAVLVSVETNAARIRWGDRATGHSVAAAGSYMGYGQQVVKRLKVGNAAASSNAALQITCFF